MVGRKLSTAALAGSIAVVAIAGGCRDQAMTAPGVIGNGALAANVRLQTGDGQVGSVATPLPLNLTVKVVDAGGTPVVGGSVKWSVLSGGGSVTPPTGISDANGLVSTSWTLGTTLGANTVRAYLTNGYVVDSVSFSATAVSGPPAIIVVDSTTLPPPSDPVGTVLPAMRYMVVDQFGHPVAGATVTFGTGFGSGSVSPTSAVTDANGEVAVTWTLGTSVGVQSQSATLAGQLPLTIVVNTTAASGRKFTILSGGNQTAPVSANLTPITVLVTDQFNNPIAGAVVTFTSVTGGGVMTPVSTVTDVSGNANATWQLGILAGVQRASVSTPAPGGGVLSGTITATATLPFRDVFAGNYFVCGVTTNDRAYCWGFGENGQLGIGQTLATPTRNRSAPTWPVTQTDTLAGPFPTFRTISGGAAHVCAISIASQLLCWGFNPDSRAFSAGTQTFGAVLISLGSIRSLGTGSSNTCYITFGGFAVCAGDPEAGSSPGTVILNPPPGGAGGYSFVAVGERHSCAMRRFDPAIPATQTPVCWGQNDNGQLGDASQTNRPAPTQISPTPVAFDSTGLASGRSHSCALAQPLPGAAYCWGNNGRGQLGNAATGTLSGAKSLFPVPVDGALQFVRLFAGGDNTCGIILSGQAYCWGANNVGQLGIGSQDNLPHPTPTAVVGGQQFRALAIGELFACGITGAPTAPGTLGTAGTIFCWGDNEYGQVGQGAFGANAAAVLTPTRVINQ